jgi:hypothetical protein
MSQRSASEQRALPWEQLAKDIPSVNSVVIIQQSSFSANLASLYDQEFIINRSCKIECVANKLVKSY